ncbi:MAG: hypothetical protein C4291_11725 [Candidatus Dadabacteria bacterium]
MARPDDDHHDTRLRLVEEHVRLENAHDLSGVMQTFGEQAAYDDEPWEDHRRGHEAVRAYYEALLAAVPDLHIEIIERHVAERALILEVVITGTHLGPWRGVPATGQRVRFPLCGVYTFDGGGRLAGERIYYDRASVMRQLGLFHDPATRVGRLMTGLTHPLTLAWAYGRKLFR